MLLQNYRSGQLNHPASPTVLDDLNADGNQNLRVTAVYEYSTSKNVAKCGPGRGLDATSSIDFPVILIPEIATSVNALS
jgi:hypothetical protein